MSSSKWRVHLDKRIAGASRRAARGRKILDELGPWLRRYHGGMPIGFAAAIIQWESGGKMGSAGDESLGEVGYFQITKSFPKKVGLPAESRYDPETNIFLGCIEYSMLAARLKKYQPLVSLGTVDSWKIARLAFAVGHAGTRKLIDNAGPTKQGKVFSAVRSYVDQVGGIPLGSQSAGKVWYRVHAVDVQWAIGKQIRPGQAIGVPVRIPSPGEMDYQLADTSLLRFMPPRHRATSVAIGLGALSFLAARRWNGPDWTY